MPSAMKSQDTVKSNSGRMSFNSSASAFMGVFCHSQAHSQPVLQMRNHSVRICRWRWRWRRPPRGETAALPGARQNTVASARSRNAVFGTPGRSANSEAWMSILGSRRTASLPVRPHCVPPKSGRTPQRPRFHRAWESVPRGNQTIAVANPKWFGNLQAWRRSPVDLEQPRPDSVADGTVRAMRNKRLESRNPAASNSPTRLARAGSCPTRSRTTGSFPSIGCALTAC